LEGRVNKGTIGLSILMVLCILFFPVVGETGDSGIEKGIQRNLQQSETVLEQLSVKLKAGSPVVDEINKLQELTEDIKSAHLLLKERFRLREKEMKGSKAREGTGRGRRPPRPKGII
jgi:hypothetical protein